MTSRTQFETKYPVPEGVTWNPDDARYVLFHRKQCSVSQYEAHVERWVVWQAARESVVVELPEGFTHHGASDRTDYVLEAGSVVAAIEAAGAKVKS